MKILNIIPSFEGGGAERQLSYIAPFLGNSGHEIHIAYLREGINFSRLVNSEVILHPLKCRSNHDPAILWQVVKLIKRLQPQVLHSWILQMDVMASLASFFTGVPWLFREYNTPVEPLPLKSKLRLFAARKAHAVISNSVSGDAFWRMKAYPRYKFFVPNALPLNEIDQVEPVNLMPYGFFGKKLVLFAGRFAVDKNIENLLEAVAQVVKDENVVAMLCGDGPLLISAKDYIKKRGLDERVKFPGYVTNIWGLMKASDVFVSISHREGRPNTVVEAMGAETPIVVSDIPMHREFLDEDSAYFVNQHNPVEVVKAIKSCLYDNSEAYLRTKRAKEIVGQWSVASVSQEYIDIYKKLYK